MAFTEDSRQLLLKELKANKLFFQEKPWQNYMGTVKKHDAIIVQVDTEEQVRQVILAVKTQNDTHPNTKITIRAAAGWQDKPSKNIHSLFSHTPAPNQYNESFSFSEGTVADVIIQFSKKFQRVKILKPSPDRLVEVTAGMQIAQLADVLHKNKLSLSTVSSMPWASAVGLAATGGHGTGRDEPAFSGQITSMTVCDMNGEIREIQHSDPDFTSLCTAHAGMLGIVLKMKLTTVPAFRLEETIKNYNKINLLQANLQNLLSTNQYFTLTYIPTYSGIDDKEIEKWQVRLWNHTTKATDEDRPKAHTVDIGSFLQELNLRAGNSVQNYLMHPNLQELIPAFMQFSATITTAVRGTESSIGHEKDITHFQAAFPKPMQSVSYMIPVNITDAGELLGKIMARIDDLLQSAAKAGEYPITYAVYARFIKGSNGGLSSTATRDPKEHILIFDLVTHSNAPGLKNFERQFQDFFNHNKIKPRYHLGSNFPVSIESYSDFLDEGALKDYLRAITAWHGSREKLEQSPFFTPYLKKMLLTPPKLDLTFEEIDLSDKGDERQLAYLVSEESIFLYQLILTLDTLQCPAESQEAQKRLIEQCSRILTHLESRSLANSILSNS